MWATVRALVARTRLPRCPYCHGYTERSMRPCSAACPGMTAEAQADAW